MYVTKCDTNSKVRAMSAQQTNHTLGKSHLTFSEFFISTLCQFFWATFAFNTLDHHQIDEIKKRNKNKVPRWIREWGPAEHSEQGTTVNLGVGSGWAGTHNARKLRIRDAFSMRTDGALMEVSAYFITDTMDIESFILIYIHDCINSLSRT